MNSKHSKLADKFIEKLGFNGFKDSEDGMYDLESRRELDESPNTLRSQEIPPQEEHHIAIKQMDDVVQGIWHEVKENYAYGKGKEALDSIEKLNSYLHRLYLALEDHISG